MHCQLLINKYGISGVVIDYTDIYGGWTVLVVLITYKNVQAKMVFT